MVTQYDNKGKIFTQVIAKKPVSVIIQTTTNIVHGTIHVRPSERVIDEMNMSIQFIAVTDVAVKNVSGEELYTCDFLTLNKDQIVWIIPDDEVQMTG